MSIVIVWWIWLQVMGLAALPLAYRFFRRLPDRGYVFARPLGLLLTSYVLWLGGSVGWLRNTVGGALFSLLLVSVASLVLYRRSQDRGEPPAVSATDPGLLAWLRSNRRLVLAVEILFAAALALWSLLRAYSPELTTAGGEKFMEIMYLNSIGRSEYFPPHDAWLSGQAISYYYFGYVMIATLTRLSGFPAHLTFNVGLASLFALTCTGAFGIVYNLVKAGTVSSHARSSRGEPTQSASPAPLPIAWGILGAVLVAVLGNLEGFLEVLYNARLLSQGFWRWLDIQEINESFSTAPGLSLMPTRSGWWWWRASRVIHDLDPLGNSMGIQPIDEFPGFSFLLGDMHPHVLALPFVLLALGVALNELYRWYSGTSRAEISHGWLAPIKNLSPLVPLCLGALAFLNTWDFPIYLAVFVAAYALGHWSRYHHESGTSRFDGRFLRDVALTAAAVAALGLLFYLPFYVGFQSQAGGLLPTLYVGTRFRQYFVMFGPFLVSLAGFLVFLILSVRGTTPRRNLFRSWAKWTAAFLLLPLAIMLLLVSLMLLTPSGREFLESIRRVPFVYQIVGDAPWLSVLGRLLGVKLRTWVMPLVVASMAALGVVLLQHSTQRDEGPPGPGSDTNSASYPLEPPDLQDPESRIPNQRMLRPSIQFVLLCAVMGLLLTLSVEFVYLVDNFRVRMNTIFKFYFQAWVLMAIASTYAVYWLRRSKGWLRSAFLTGFWLLSAMGMVYPVLGNISRAGHFAPTPTLDGTAYLAASHPEDYAAIGWLNEHVGDAPIILEAPGSGGSSYVYEGRVAALTGLPTLLGWAGHEGQWRGNYEIQSARDPDIQTIYSSPDIEMVENLLNRYEVTYVYVGPLEHSKYDPRGLKKFEQFMDVVYQERDVTIYKIRR